MATRTDTETLYMISKHTLDPISRMTISKDEFDKIKEKGKILRAVQELQIRYEMILKNYMALEKEFYSMLLEYDLKIRDYDNFLDRRIRVNTLFLNLLTAATSYRNYVRDDDEKVAEQKLFNIFNIDKELIEKIFPKKEYGFLTGIRNHLQHGRVLHSLTLNKSSLETKSEENFLKKLGYTLLKLNLYVDRNNEELKIPSILNKKLDKAGRLSLHYISRFCMDIHNSIHCEIMDIIKPAIQEARDYIENMHKDWEEHVKEKIPDSNIEYIKTKLCSYAYTIPDINISETIPLFLGLDDARITLSEKNRRNLHLLKNKYEL